MAIQTFTSGQVLTAAQVNALNSNDFNQTVSTKTASYTLVAADKGTRVVMNVSSASTVTVNTSLFSAGDTLVIQNIASNATVVTAGTATVSTAGSLSIPQFGSGTLFFTSASAAIFLPSAGPAASSGLTLIGSTALSGTSTTVTSAFSAAYDAYRIYLVDVNNSASPVMKMQFGSANTGYKQTQMFCNDTTAWTFNAAATTFIEVGQTQSSIQSQAIIDVISPFAAVPTFFTAIMQANTQRDMTIGFQNSGTSFTAFTIFNTQSSTMSGTIKLYGFAS